MAETARFGAGKILANFREVPALSLPLVNEIIERLRQAGIQGIIALGEGGKAITDSGRGGQGRDGTAGGLNPVAAAAESGIDIESHAMSGIIDYQALNSFWELFKHELRS